MENNNKNFSIDEELPVSESVTPNIIHINDARLSNCIYIDNPIPVKKRSCCFRVGQILSGLCVMSIFMVMLIVFITHKDQYDEYSNTNSTQYN